MTAGGNLGTSLKTGIGSMPGISAGRSELFFALSYLVFALSETIARERCMDLVSFESPEEFRHFAEMIFTGVL